MKKSRTIGRLLGTIFLMLGAGNAAWAVDYSGTLAFNSYTATNVTFQGPFGPATGDVGIDLDRYNLGNALSGSAVGITFTTKSFNPLGTVLAVLFATDPNDTIFNDPTSLAGFINPGINVNDFLTSHVTNYQFAAYGFPSNGTTSVSALFTPPITFTAGTTYYAFVAGGSAINSVTKALTDSSVGYTLSVNAVPEPEAWATMIVGLGLVALRLRRRAGTALA